MGMKTGCTSLCGALGLAGLSVSTAGPINVTTYHNDNARTGAYTQETILTPSNVNYKTFGRLYSVAMDGAVYAQPLYLSGVSIAGGTHNVLYAFTEHDSVYAIDADSGTIYAQVSLVPAGGVPVDSVKDLNCYDVLPETGITGTPVIDSAGGTLYVVAKSKVNGTIVQYLHALNVTTLAEMLGGPVAIQAAVPGNDAYGSGGTVTFDSKHQFQRPALLLVNGHLVIGWGSTCDADPWHGWVISYNAATLAQEAAFNTTPNGNRAGIWMSGGGLAADVAGSVYFSTGNGSWNGTTDYGDSIVKLGPPANNSLPVVDYFTPFDQGMLNTDDLDVSSGGLVLLPTSANGKQLLAQSDKLGNIYLLDSANLGKYCVNLTPSCNSGTDPQIPQEIRGANSGIWGSPAYWNGNLYWAGANDVIKARSFNANGSGLISLTPTSQSAQIFAFSAPTPSVSSNGTVSGILWALDGSAGDSTCDGGGASCLGLYAYDAANLSTLLYASSQAANNRDSPGVALKFETPIIANGKVYVGTRYAVSAFGLLTNVVSAAATPTFNLAPGVYTTAQSVILSDSTPGAVIHYTTDGTLPTVNSAIYTSPLGIAASETIEAVAMANGYTSSLTASASFLIGSWSSVNLSSADNVYGVVADGTPTSKGGWDNDGYAYSASQLGTIINYAGSTFAVTATGSDAVSNTTLSLPTGRFGTLALLASAVNGNQTNQTFVVTYTDGTKTRFTQSISDWLNPAQIYSGETRVKQMSYNIASNGSTHGGALYIFGYSFALDTTKTVKSLALPSNRNVVVLAVNLLNPSGSPGTGGGSGGGSSGGTGTGTIGLTGMTVVGSASVGGGVLALTAAVKNQTGAAWSASPVNIQTFTNDFTFQLTPGTAGTSDGLTFVIQNAGAGALGSGGAGLGYRGIGTSLAAKFDIYNNNGEGPNSTGFYTNGSWPTQPSLNLTASGVNLHGGNVLHAHMTYDGTTLALTLTDTVTNASFRASRAVNIPATVGAGSAYVGFTGATGGSGATQTILTWSFSAGGTTVGGLTGGGAQRLEELDNLRKKGLMTSEVYARERRKILKTI